MYKYLRTVKKYFNTDYVFVSYPKSGRTWLRMQLGLYLIECLKEEKFINAESKILSNPLDTDNLVRALGIGAVLWDHGGSGLIEKNAIEEVNTRKFLIARKKKCFLIRDPKDVMVSSYFQATKRINVFEGNISSFVRDENYGINRWIKLHNAWYNVIKSDKSTKLVKYEDMQKNSIGVLSFILSDLGIKYLKDELLMKAIEGAKFEQMKKMEKKEEIDSSRLKPGNKNDPESFKVRKGKVGDFREYLNESDIIYINEALMKQKCQLYFEYYHQVDIS